jgi:hypothetical protein
VSDALGWEPVTQSRLRFVQPRHQSDVPEFDDFMEETDG